MNTPVAIPSCIGLIESMQQFQQATMMGSPIIVIAETSDPYVSQNPSTIPAPALLPDYSAVSMMIDGNNWGAQDMYYRHLGSDVCQEYIQIILAAAVLNKQPMFIMFDNDEMAMEFGKMFLNYLANVYGFYVGTANSASYFVGDARYNSLLTLLYSKKYLNDPNMILFKLTGEIGSDMVPIVLVNYLANDMRPIVDAPTLENYENYFRQLAADMKKVGKPLYDPMEAII